MSINIKLYLFIILCNLCYAGIAKAQVNVGPSKTYTLAAKEEKTDLDHCLNAYVFVGKDSLRSCLEELGARKDQFSPIDAFRYEMLLFSTHLKGHAGSSLARIDSFIEKYESQHYDAYTLLLYYQKSTILNRQARYEETILMLNKPFFAHYPKQSNLNALGLLVWIYGNLDKAYVKKNRYSKALENAMIVEKIALEIKVIEFQSYAVSLFSEIYGTLSSSESNLGTKEDRQRYEVLLEQYLKKAVDLSLLVSNARSTGVASYNMAVFLSLHERIAESKVYLNLAIDNGLNLKFHELLFNVYDVLADLLMEENQLDSSFYYINEMKKEADTMNYPYFNAMSRLKFLHYYHSVKKYAKASQLFDELADDETINNNYRLKKRYYLIGYEMEKGKGDFQKSLEHYISHQNMKDSITNETNTVALENLRARYESKFKDKEIQFLSTQSKFDKSNIKKKNNLIWFIILSGFILFTLLLYFFQQRQKLEKERTLNAQQKLLRTQLNPHFIFNALNSIQQYIYQKKSPQKVADYLAKFSRLTRRILQHSKEDLISLEEELEFIQDYMDLQKIRFDRPFSYVINVDESIEIDDVLIPPMFTQPFIENAIEHGIFSKGEKGIIKIKITSEANMLVVVLEDNGIGIERTKLMKKNKKHQSLAINITKDRLRILEKKFKQKAKLAIFDISDKENFITGTKVQLNIPLVYQ